MALTSEGSSGHPRTDTSGVAAAATRIDPALRPVLEELYMFLRYILIFIDIVVKNARVMTDHSRPKVDTVAPITQITNEASAATG
jgi:hypothetical protein